MKKPRSNKAKTRQAIQKQPRKSNSVSVNAQIKLLGIKLISVLTIMLAFAGIITIYVAPEQSKDLWVVITPILSATISGILGFLAGQQSRNQNSK